MLHKSKNLRKTSWMSLLPGTRREGSHKVTELTKLWRSAFSCFQFCYSLHLVWGNKTCYRGNKACYRAGKGELGSGMQALSYCTLQRKAFATSRAGSIVALD